MHEIRGCDISKPTKQAAINAEMSVDKRMGELLDILAVESVMRILSIAEDGLNVKKAIEIEYFNNPHEPLRRGDVINAVTKANLTIRISERQVYNHLKKARLLFAIERGLRI